jgi:hypothetical protein
VSERDHIIEYRGPAAQWLCEVDQYANMIDAGVASAFDYGAEPCQNLRQRVAVARAHASILVAGSKQGGGRATCRHCDRLGFTRVRPLAKGSDCGRIIEWREIIGPR